MNRKKIDALTQRERKYAITKTQLLEALLEELEEKSLSQVLIKDLAKKANVSEPTFFNYFSSKQDMLYYFIQMWATEMNAIAKREVEEKNSYLEAIIAIFIRSAKSISLHPQIMLEIIAFHTLKTDLQPHTISAAEKWLFFPEIEEVEKLADRGLESIVPPLLAQAVDAGELPKETDIEGTFLNISSLFFGTALLLLKESPHLFVPMLEQQLYGVFKALEC